MWKEGKKRGRKGGRERKKEKGRATRLSGKYGN
jgi:hypothetical protein